MNTTLDYSGFDSPEFVAEKVGQSRSAQILNPSITPQGFSASGFAVKKKNAEAVGFTPPTDWTLVEHEFKSGDKEEVYLTSSPRLVIVHRTPLYLRLRETGEMLGESSRVPDWYNNKSLYKIGSYVWVFVLDENDERCMAEPMLVALNGASGASFNRKWLQTKTDKKDRSGFCVEMEHAYAKATNQPHQEKGRLFHAHCIYCPKFQVEEVGTKPNTAYVSVVFDYEPGHISKLIPPGSEFSNLIKISHEDKKNWQPSALLKKAVDGLESKNVNGCDDDDYPPY